MSGKARTTEVEVRRALEAGRERRARERRAASVRYDYGRDAIEVELTDGAAIRLPRTTLEEFRDVPTDAMAGLRVSPAGYAIRLDSHDIAVSVHGLVAALATPGDMAATLGRMGGAATTERKREAARTNGTKGGRPRRKVA